MNLVSANTMHFVLTLKALVNKVTNTRKCLSSFNKRSEDQ